MQNQNIRRAARTVIIDKNNNKVAILEVKNGAYHKIPGGGIEKGESIEDGAIREAKEESGSDVKLLKNLGESSFKDPKIKNLIHHSVCFLAEKVKDHKQPNFTEKEKEKKFKLLWLDFDEAIQKFENIKSEKRFEIEMNNRDLNYLKKAKKFFKI